MDKIRILIVDDQPIVCEGLKVILQFEKDFEVLGVCCNGQEALKFCEQTKPDVVLMDARMPVISGITATKEIKNRFSKIKVLILTTFNEEMLIIEGLQNGANGFVLKDMQPDQLCKMIRVVHSGGVCLHPEVTQKIINKISAPGGACITDNLSGNSVVSLTNREKEVMILIGRGLSNTEISSVLYIVEGTVKNHVSNLLAKLGARDRTQLAILAHKNHDLS